MFYSVLKLLNSQIYLFLTLQMYNNFILCAMFNVFIFRLIHNLMNKKIYNIKRIA